MRSGSFASAAVCASAFFVSAIRFFVSLDWTTLSSFLSFFEGEALSVTLCCGCRFGSVVVWVDPVTCACAPREPAIRAATATPASTPALRLGKKEERWFISRGPHICLAPGAFRLPTILVFLGNLVRCRRPGHFQQSLGVLLGFALAEDRGTGDQHLRSCFND